MGEKTAITLLEKYKTLDGIYKNIDKMEARWKTKLEANKENAYLSYTLAQIKTGLDIELNLEHAKAQDLDVPASGAFFKEMEFRTLLKTLEKVTGQPVSSAFTTCSSPPSVKTSGQMSMFANEPQVVVSPKVESNITVRIVDTETKLDDLVKALNKAKVIPLTRKQLQRKKCARTSLATFRWRLRGEGYYIPIGHNVGTNLPLKKVVAALEAPMANQNRKSGAQREIRLHRAGTARTCCFAAHVRYDAPPNSSLTITRAVSA
ncbi:MAG: 5'-3' exonuclease H3TH domain-containing protein [Anaerolineales bacterium]